MRIKDACGEFFTPAAVVDASRAKTAPLHVAFEWNNKVAGAAWRENQAAYLIRHIVAVVEEVNNTDDAPIRAFVSVVPERGEKPCYTSTDHAFSTPDLREQVLARALSDMKAFERRYAAYIDLSEVSAAFRVAVSRATAAETHAAA